LKQVLKKRNWIVLDIKGKLRIYDVGKWLQDHPGGASNLRKGIKANKYYQNKDKYHESPIQLFKQIGAHMSGKVVQNMLVKENDKVKFIGVLKKV
jgi:cytochrome b involved in lipid metabolism